MKETFVSIIGRPNVGKSTLFNKLLGKRKSIVDSQEGITRDRVYGEMNWCGHKLNFIDTGGYIPKDLDFEDGQFGHKPSFQKELAQDPCDKNR